MSSSAQSHTIIANPFAGADTGDDGLRAIRMRAAASYRQWAELVGAPAQRTLIAEAMVRTPQWFGSASEDARQLRDLRQLKRKVAVGGSGKFERDTAGPANPSSQSRSSGHRTPLSQEAALKALANGAQAAVVKVSGYGAGAKAARSMIDYNSRQAELPLETDRGEQIDTRDGRNAMLREWEAFYDSRVPSTDVVTLQLTWPASQATDAMREAVIMAMNELLAKQRFASTPVQTRDVQSSMTFVMATARAGARRMKVSDEALQQFSTHLNTRLAEFGHPAHLAIQLTDKGHGVDAANRQLAALAERSANAATKEGLAVTVETAASLARSWKRELRSYEVRDVMHLIVSAKAGTPKEPFVQAVCAFMGEEFGGHRYAFALHGPEDVKEAKRTQHIHVHAVVVMRAITGAKLDPRIGDFRRWRETMAHHARANGIAMVGTRRLARLNAPAYTLGQLHAVKNGVASDQTIARVAARQANTAVSPKHAHGIASSSQARGVLDAIATTAWQTGDQPTLTGVQAMLQRHAEAIRTIQPQDASLTSPSGITSDVEATISAITKAAAMLNADEKRIRNMQDRTQFINQAQAFNRAIGLASESLRGDPALKARFDAETKPMRDALDTQLKRLEADRAMAAATDARVREAQARESAGDIRRAGTTRGDVTLEDRRSEGEIRSRGREAAEDARKAEQQLRALGVQNVDGIKRQADTSVAADDQQKPDLARQNESQRREAQERDTQQRGTNDRGGRRRGG
jgi:hypothetical protein